MRSLLLALSGILALDSAVRGQIVSIVSGNGQLVCPRCMPTPAVEFEPLVVEVTLGGTPLPNVVVYWSVQSVGFYWESWQGPRPSMMLERTVTDANGRVSNTFLPGTPPSDVSGLSHVQSTVVASAFYSSVTFSETLVIRGPKGTSQVFVTPIYPLAGDSIVGAAGQRGRPFLATVMADVGEFKPPIAGAEMRLISDPSLPATLNCDSQEPLPVGTVLTDATGVATCTPIFGGRTGAGRFVIRVGGSFATWGPFDFVVGPGPPGNIRVISGDNQSAAPGSQLPLPLVAQVEDAAGNTLADVPVIWDVPQGSASVIDAKTIADQRGRVSATAVLGGSGTPVQIRVRAAANSAVAAIFHATVEVAGAELRKLSGDNQGAPPNAVFQQPLVVQVTNRGQPIAGVPIIFAVDRGSATMGTSGVRAQVNTDAQGRASVRVTAGPRLGTVIVTATAYSLRQAFQLSVRITDLQFLNAAGFQRDFISPCSIATITGRGLATQIRGSVAASLFAPLPFQLGGVSVRFGNASAPLYSVANGAGEESATVQVPCEVAPGTTPVSISVNAYASPAEAVVSALSPGIFEVLMSDGRRRAMLTRVDGSFISLEDSARPGELLRLYVTGLGQTTPRAVTNRRAMPGTDMNVVATAAVSVNDAAARVEFARYSQDLIGVYEIAFELPADAPAGDNVPLAIAVQPQEGEPVWSNRSAIPIRP